MSDNSPLPSSKHQIHEHLLEECCLFLQYRYRDMVKQSWRLVKALLKHFMLFFLLYNTKMCMNYSINVEDVMSATGSKLKLSQQFSNCQA